MSDDDHLRDDPELPGGDEYTGGLDIDAETWSVRFTDGTRRRVRNLDAQVPMTVGDLRKITEALQAATRALKHERDLSRQLRDRLDQREAEIVDLCDRLDERETDVLDLLARIDRAAGPAVREVLDEHRDTFAPLRPSTVARPRYPSESADDYSLRDEL